MMILPVHAVVLLFVGILLFAFAFSLFSAGNKKTKPRKKLPSYGIAGEKGVCPVCTTVLDIGEQLKSALFPGEGDRVCHIFGCPHCHPYMEQGIRRICPVCKKPVSADGYLVARLFERSNRTKHVHILGCTTCRVPSGRKGN